MALRRFSLAAIFLIAASTVAAFAQGPLQKRINFSASTPFELKGTNVVLPSGDYVLFQIDRQDPQLFALYSGRDMKHRPIAMLRTVRIPYDMNTFPGKTRVFMDIDEASPRN